MLLFPQKHFSWREPKAFLDVSYREARSQIPWRFIMLVAVLNIGVLVGASAIAATHSGKSPISLWLAVAMTFLGIGYIVFVQPWLVSKMPSTIEIKGDYVVRINGGTSFVFLKNVKSFAWRVEGSYAVLKLRIENGAERQFGVPIEVSREDVAAFFYSRSIAEDCDFTAAAEDVASARANEGLRGNSVVRSAT